MFKGDYNLGQQRASVDECLVVAFADAERVEAAGDAGDALGVWSRLLHARAALQSIRGAWRMGSDRFDRRMRDRERPLPN